MTDTQTKINAYCFPMMVSSQPGRGDSDEEVLERWEKFDTLSKDRRDILISENIGEMIEKISRTFCLSTESTREVSRIIRELFFEKITVNSLSHEILKRIPEARNSSDEISKIIQERIFNQTESAQYGLANLKNFNLSEALAKYPAIGEQLITANYIKLKVFPEPVRPSIKNWLSDYTFTVGVSNRDPLTRGNYLFQSPNASTLSGSDRQKLTAILKSFEEKTPLKINTNTKQVVFEAPEKHEISSRPIVNLNSIISAKESTRISAKPRNYTPPQEAVEPQPRFQSDEERISAWRRNLPKKETLSQEIPKAENIHFSSPQTFSTEKPIAQTRPILQNNPARPQITKINYSAPKRPLPKNVVDLREE